MNIPIPDFVPVFRAETIQMVSIILLIAGVCAAGAGALLLLLNKRRGNEKNTLAWILVCAGVLLTINHSLRLIF